MTFQTYNLNLPNPPDDPANDVSGMQTNTNSISGLLLQDHFGFNDNAGGNHKQVHLKNEAAPGGLGANADGVFYANLASGQSWPFWQNALGSFQLAGQNLFTTNGYVLLPAGLILQWGIVNGTHGGNSHFNGGDGGTVTFSSANIAFPNNCFGVLTNLLYNTNTGSAPSSAGSVNVDLFTLSKLKFDWNIAIGSTTQYVRFFWLAVGN